MEHIHAPAPQSNEHSREQTEADIERTEEDREFDQQLEEVATHYHAVVDPIETLLRRINEDLALGSAALASHNGE